MIRLCVTPGPKLTESAMGFALRLSGANGFVSPWRLFDLTGMAQNDFRTAGIKLEKLAAITGRSVEDFRRLSLQTNSSRQRSWSLLRKEIQAEELSITNAKFCPLCVAEKGFIEAHWQLSLMVGCSEHHRKALTHCSECKKAISWFRPHLLVCSCDANLLIQEQSPLVASTAQLLDVIRRKALNDSTRTHDRETSCIEKMYTLELQPALTLIRTLGALGTQAIELPRCCAAEELVELAASVLTEWPDRFHDLLEATAIADLSRNLDQARIIYRRLYRKFFKERELATNKEAQFLRDGLLAFATSGRIDRRVKRLFLESLPKSRFAESFTTVREIAADAGVQPITAMRYLQQHPEAICVETRQTRRFLSDRRAALIGRKTPGRILRVRDAARRLGIPGPVLRELRRRGTFMVSSHFPTKPGYHEGDVDRFRDQLLSVRQAGSQAVDFVPFGEALRNPHDTIETKSRLVEAVLSGKLPAFHSDNESFAGILLDRASYQDQVQTFREECSAGVPSREAARVLHCDPECIPSLMAEGHIAGTETPTGLRIKRDSIVNFGRAWMSMAAVAKAVQTSSRALYRRCGVAGIPVMLVPGRPGTFQPFIKAGDQQRVIALLRPASNCPVLREASTQ